MADCRIRARERRLRLHRDVAGEQDPVGLDPDDGVAARVVGAHRADVRVHAAEIEIVVVFEGDVGLAESASLSSSALIGERVAKTFASCSPNSAMSFTWSFERISLVVRETPGRRDRARDGRGW